MNSSLRLEQHIITHGLCLKLNSSLLKALDFKENELNSQISIILEKFFAIFFCFIYNFKRKKMEKLLESVNVALDADILLIDPKSQSEKVVFFKNIFAIFLFIG